MCMFLRVTFKNTFPSISFNGNYDLDFDIIHSTYIRNIPRFYLYFIHLAQFFLFGSLRRTKPFCVNYSPIQVSIQFCYKMLRKYSNFPKIIFLFYLTNKFFRFKFFCTKFQQHTINFPFDSFFLQSCHPHPYVMTADKTSAYPRNTIEESVATRPQQAVQHCNVPIVPSLSIKINLQVKLALSSSLSTLTEGHTTAKVQQYFAKLKTCAPGFNFFNLSRHCLLTQRNASGT